MADASVAPSPERWRQIEALFARARVLAPDQRDAFLETVCADDPTLRHDLDRLLAALDDADDFLEGLDPERAAALLDEALDVEQTIGRYRLVREVGRGGMGAVYLADRATGQFQQQVALKLIKRGMDSEAILRRFLHERQILARLQHPHIARFYDGDVTDDGRPYFAMEYVDGLPINRYCDEHHLDVEARLRLFQDVCRAVHYAHQNLVVHRDLKPSNMLVTVQGELKLLDFGIAKLLGGDGGAEGTMLTEAGVRAMTPEYAAPEQIRGEAVTTATDVYALGVVLYELLTGHRPYRFERQTPQSLAQAIGDVEPERPSTAVRRVEEIPQPDGTTEMITPEDVSRVRNTQPHRLRRRLSGDLDVVVLKALRKESERRYASAEALVEDIRRHLAGLPVHAQRDTLAYRASKFVRRHAVGVTFAAVLALLTIGAGVALALQQAATARERDKAEEIKDLVLRLFEVSDPNEAPGETITARALLDAGAARIQVELSGQPRVQAEMMTVVGDIYRKLGLYDPAQPLLERALALRRSVLGADHQDVAASLHNLATLLLSKGEYDAADSLFREALAIKRRLLGEEHPEVAITLSALAELRFNQGDYRASERLFREALALRRTRLGEEHPQIATTLNDLAIVLQANGEYDAAEPLFHEALAMQRKVLGPEHTDLTMTLTSLATLLRAKGDYDAAELLHREALGMKRKLLGKEHPSVANTLNNLGGLLRQKGDYGEAERLYREALAMKRKLLGQEHPSVATTLSNLAVLLRDKGDYNDAEPLFREALAMNRKLLGQEHPNVATTLSGLALLLHQKGNYDAAESLYREVLAMRRKVLGEAHPRVATILTRLAATSTQQGNYEAAEPLYREALEIRVQALPEGHWRLAETRSALGACLSVLGRYDEAEPLLLAGYGGLREARGEQHSTTRRARDYLVVHFERRGLPQQAEAYRPKTPGH